MTATNPSTSAIAASSATTSSASASANTNTTAASTSTPASRATSPAGSIHRFSTPPPPPSAAVPTDFRSSLAAWWGTTSYKEARLAEERLLRRMAHYRPPAPDAPKHTGSWWSWSNAERAHAEKGEVQEVTAPIEMGSGSGSGQEGDKAGSGVEGAAGGLVATLRNVFIPTPDPALAPAHPADPIESGGAGASPTPSIASSQSAKDSKRACKKANNGKLVDYINTLEITRPEDKDAKDAVVVLHGYAAAHGFFFRNWDPIATHAATTHRRTFFLDWLGMGLSSRPSAALLSSPSTSPVPARVARAEHFFLASLEAWREAVGIERMVLVGHSLGGYLASAYAVRYPQRVSSLVLVSPAGIPHGPEYKRFPTTAEAAAAAAAAGGSKGRGSVGMNAGDLGEGASTGPQSEPGMEAAVDAAQQELGQGQGQEHTGDGPEGENGAGKFEAKGEAKKWRENREQSMFRRNAMKFFVWGWERGISPFTFLRSMGPFGPMFAGKYSLRRFSAQSDEDVRDLHGYIYNTSVLKGSGEFCISHILAPGAYARIPIVDRIHNLKVPVTFIYGDNDWMDAQGGHESVAALAKAGNESAEVHVVPQAGHHVYLDNPDETNRIIGEAIRGAGTGTGTGETRAGEEV